MSEHPLPSTSEPWLIIEFGPHGPNRITIGEVPSNAGVFVYRACMALVELDAILCSARSNTNNKNRRLR